MPESPLDRRAFLGVGASALALAACGLRANASLEDLGAPGVNIGRFHDMRLGPDERGRLTRVYMAFAQAQGLPPFLLVLDATSGRSIGQYYPPRDLDVQGFKSVYVARGGLVYVGGYKPARLLRFDPRRPEAGLQSLGVLPDANMIWWMIEAADGRVFMTTSSEARLYSWNPASGALRDHGRLSTENKYATVLLSNRQGSRLYAVVAPEHYDVVAYDVRSEARRGLLSSAERGVGFIGILQGDDGRLRAELPGDIPVPAGDEEVVALPQYRLADGRVLRATAEELTLNSDGDEPVHFPLRYEADAWLNKVHAARDGSVFGGTESPLRLCHYLPWTRTWKVLGNPFATADTGLAAVADWQGKLVLAAYPGCDLALYDPAREWRKGPEPSDNPWTWGTPDGVGHTRPSGVVVGRDNRIYVASDSSYGVHGGAVACIDPTTGRTVYNIRDLFLERSPVAIAADTARPIVYFGCTRTARGTEPTRAACIIAWDAVRRRVIWEIEPIQGAESIGGIVCIGARIIGAAYFDYQRQEIFVIDAPTGRTLHRAATDIQAVIQGNLRESNGRIYGLSYVDPTLFRIDPTTYQVETLARLPKVQGYSFTLAGEAAYFSSGLGLLRYPTS
jgi:hypothetical protein